MGGRRGSERGWSERPYWPWDLSKPVLHIRKGSRYGPPVHYLCGLVHHRRKNIINVGFAPHLVDSLTLRTHLFNPFIAVSLTLLSLQVDAHRRQSLARLPMVLVLHLKRFLFDKTGGSQKLMKQVSYKIDLEVVRGERGWVRLLRWCEL